MRYASRVQVTVAIFGVRVSIVGARPDGCVVDLAGGTHRLDPAGGLARCERPAEQADPGPFAFGAFGAANRLTWPGGGCSVRPRSQVAYWGARWAAIADQMSLTVIDAVANRQARLELAIHAAWTGCATAAGRLWIGGMTCVYAIELAALEVLLATGERDCRIERRDLYPLRDPAATTDARVAWVFDGDDALVNIGTRQVHLYGKGFEKGTTIVLRDELYPGTYAVAELPTGARVPLATRADRLVSSVRVVRGRSRDPAASGEALTATDPRLEALLAELARDPDHDATRLVLVDLLQELGAAFGTWVAQGGGKRARRKDALGPLAHFLDDVAYRGGLPWSATLVRRPPTDPALVAQAAADLRLGMLSALRAGRGPRSIYAALVGSPRAIGLRRVDAFDRPILAALIAGGRTQLTHLHDVRFANAAVVELLADPTFDRARELEVFVQPQHLQNLLGRIARDAYGVFARAPRRVVLRQRYGSDLELVAPALARFPELPVVELQVDFVAVRQEGRRIVAHVGRGRPLVDWLPVLVRALPQLDELVLDDPSARLAAAEAFPHARVR